MAATPNTSSWGLKAGQLHPRAYEYEATYRAYLFGSFRLYHRSRRLGGDTFGREKARLILIWFLLNPGKPESIEQFIDLFWPDSPPEKAIGNFHVALHCLRRTLEPHLRSGQESSFIRRSMNNFYTFQPDKRWWTDTTDLEMLFERANACDSHGERRRACYYYGRVADYCAQGFLPEREYGEWLAAHRWRYEQIYAQALMRLMKLHSDSSEQEELLEYAYQMLQLDPQNVVATKAIFDSQVKSDDVGHARRTLRSFLESVPHELREPLRKEFGAFGA